MHFSSITLRRKAKPDHQDIDTEQEFTLSAIERTAAILDQLLAGPTARWGFTDRQGNRYALPIGLPDEVFEIYREGIEEDDEGGRDDGLTETFGTPSARNLLCIRTADRRLLMLSVVLGERATPNDQSLED